MEATVSWEAAVAVETVWRLFYAVFSGLLMSPKKYILFSGTLLFGTFTNNLISIKLFHVVVTWCIQNEHLPFDVFEDFPINNKHDIDCWCQNGITWSSNIFHNHVSSRFSSIFLNVNSPLNDRIPGQCAMLSQGRVPGRKIFIGRSIVGGGDYKNVLPSNSSSCGGGGGCRRGYSEWMAFSS